MLRENATIKRYVVKKNEKAILLPKKIMLGDFSFHITVFVPKAELKKPKPKVALTLDVGDSSCRFVSDSVDALIESQAEIILLLENNKESIEKAVQTESDKWFEKQQSEQERLNIERKNRKKTN